MVLLFVLVAVSGAIAMATIFVGRRSIGGVNVVDLTEAVVSGVGVVDLTEACVSKRERVPLLGSVSLSN